MALFKKNLYYYGRNWKGTCCEILAPLLLVLLILLLRNKVEVLEFDQITYPATPGFSSVDAILNSDLKDIILT